MIKSYSIGPEMNMPFRGAKLAILTPRHVLTLLRDTKPEIEQPGRWDLPGGGRDGDEDGLNCALRETHEELGLSLAPSEVIWGRRFERHGLWNWFFAVRAEESVMRAITFGDEGRGWAAMEQDLFLAHPNGIPHFQHRLRLCLGELAETKNPPLI